ncbi:threonine synthase [bacterium]|nr:threonine synthase [candidate division CSSED10-310 bacterium]
MMFYSTNHSSPQVDLRTALLTGQAPDRGLYMPVRMPEVTAAELESLRDLDYSGVAQAIIGKFTGGIFEPEQLKVMCERVYRFEVPLELVAERTHVMRLDRGPTASFKDFAATMMGQMMSSLMQQEGGRLLILTATSGDTGSAIAHAFHRVDRIDVVVLFPPAEVSNRQRKQMTTLGGNVATIGIGGKFDDCQALVKRAFADPDLSGMRLTSANSINIGRLIPQIVYYFYAYSRVTKPGEEIVFSVPCGNFGDLMGVVMGMHMGLPVRRLVVATNANDEVPRFMQTGRYEKIAPSRVCISNAMNVGHPSNFARLVDVYGGWMDETGMLHRQPDMQRMQRDLWAVSISEKETRVTIQQAWNRHHLLLEPHGAVGWAGLTRFLAEEAPECPCVSVETAHPAKFPEEIISLLGCEPEVPPSLAGIEERTEHFETMPIDYEQFKQFLLARYA